MDWNDKEAVKKYKRKKYSNNRKKLLEKQKKYYQDNKEEIKNKKIKLYHERRSSFFSGKVCEECGSKENLELHHKDPRKKDSHKIWFWSEEKRLKEIEKCIVICHDCHNKKHKKDYAFAGRATLSINDVKSIKVRLLHGEAPNLIAKDYPVSTNAIRNIKAERTWRNIK